LDSFANRFKFLWSPMYFHLYNPEDCHSLYKPSISQINESREKFNWTNPIKFESKAYRL